MYGDFPGPHCVVEGGVERIAEVVANPEVLLDQILPWLVELNRPIKKRGIDRCPSWPHLKYQLEIVDFARLHAHTAGPLYPGPVAYLHNFCGYQDGPSHQDSCLIKRAGGLKALF